MKEKAEKVDKEGDKDGDKEVDEEEWGPGPLVILNTSRRSADTQ